MPVLKAKVDGVWVDVGGAGSEEVEVGASEPAGSTIELWVDTDDPGQSFPNMPRGYVGHQIGPTNDPTFSSTLTIVPGTAVTWVADPSRRYRITITANIGNTALNASINAAIVGVTTATQTGGTGQILQMAAGAIVPICLVGTVEGLSGTQTRQLALSANASTAMYVGSFNRAGMTLVEDIGAAGQSGGGVWTEYLPRGRVAHAVAPTTDQSGITTQTLIAGTSVTFNADPTRRYVTSLDVSFLMSAAGHAQPLIVDGSNAVLMRRSIYMNVANSYTGTLMRWIEPPLSGPQTRSGAFTTDAGSASILNSAQRNASILVEDIGRI